MKFVLTSEKKVEFGVELHRIKAVKAIPSIGVEKGELGGWVEKKANLSQEGDSWVSGDARVFGNAEVFGDARVYGNAWVSGDAWVFGNARVYGDAWVYGNAWVSGDARVSGNAKVFGNARVSARISIFGKVKVSLEIKRVEIDTQKDMDNYIRQNNKQALGED